MKRSMVAKMASRVLFVLALAALVTGCTQAVVLTPEGEKVKLMAALAESEKCEKIVDVMDISATRDDPLGTYPEEIQQDINNTARNKAAEVGGFVIVPRGPAKGGKQQFDVYKCGEVKPAEKAVAPATEEKKPQ